MPPKKLAADSADGPAQPSSDVPAKDSVTLRKLAAHPSTAIMVKEALTALDSRKGASSQAIQNYIKQKYPSVDVVRLKYLVRRALKKGIETGTLVRPANSVTTGLLGKFRLAPVKEAKPKKENANPNVQKESNLKNPKKTGTKKKTDAVDEQTKPQEVLTPPKKSKKENQAGTSKVAAAKKPKGKAAETGKDGLSAPGKPKATKTTKEAKAGKATQRKTAKSGNNAQTAKTTGKGGRKAPEQI